MSDDEPSRTLCGTMLSPGWGEGRVFAYRDLLTRFDESYDKVDCPLTPCLTMTIGPLTPPLRAAGLVRREDSLTLARQRHRSPERTQP